MIIETNNFFLEPIQIEHVSVTYLGWLNDQSTSKYISSSKEVYSLEDLKNVVNTWISNQDIIFLGIFDKHTNRHIGNIKFDPVDSVNHYSVLGILIGDKDYQGKDVAREVILACADWLKEYRQINKLILGVNASNERAVKAYKKIGFKVFSSNNFPTTDNSFFMSYSINS